MAEDRLAIHLSKRLQGMFGVLLRRLTCLTPWPQNDQVRGNQPYACDIFAQTIRQAWFKSPRSFGWTIINQFNSSLPEKPGEKEIPTPMLALVATAVNTSCPCALTLLTDCCTIQVYASILDHEAEVYCESTSFGWAEPIARVLFQGSVLVSASAPWLVSQNIRHVLTNLLMHPNELARGPGSRARVSMSRIRPPLGESACPCPRQSLIPILLAANSSGAQAACGAQIGELRLASTDSTPSPATVPDARPARFELAAYEV